MPSCRWMNVMGWVGHNMYCRVHNFLAGFRFGCSFVMDISVILLVAFFIFCSECQRGNNCIAMKIVWCVCTRYVYDLLERSRISKNNWWLDLARNSFTSPRLRSAAHRVSVGAGRACAFILIEWLIHSGLEFLGNQNCSCNFWQRSIRQSCPFHVCPTFIRRKKFRCCIFMIDSWFRLVRKIKTSKQNRERFSFAGMTTLLIETNRIQTNCSIQCDNHPQTNTKPWKNNISLTEWYTREPRVIHSFERTSATNSVRNGFRGEQTIPSTRSQQPTPKRTKLTRTNQKTPGPKVRDPSSETFRNGYSWFRRSSYSQWG